MTVIIVVGVIVTIGVLIWGVFAINNYCDEKYEYKPFGIGNTLLMVLVWIFGLVALFSIPEAGSSLQLYEHLVNFDLSGEYLDSISAIFIGLGIMLVFLIRVTIKTNFLIAILALLIQLIGAIFIIIIAFLFVKKK